MEQQGDTAFAATQVVVVEDLTSKDQMHSARATLQIVADNTADHLRLLIKLNEQIGQAEGKLEQWLRANGKKDWCVFENYSGLAWEDPNRNDGWPDWEYHQYQVLKSGLGSDQTTSTAEIPVVKELVPQFWAHTQALAKAWYTFPDGLYSHDDEWNQSVSALVHSVCQLTRAANMLPPDYEPWYKFMKAWIEDFAATRIKRMATRESPAEVISAGSAGQGDAGGVIPTANPSPALSGQGDSSGVIPGDSTGSMSEEQKTQKREQLEAWARIYGTPPPQESTAGVVTKETHRFEQWLEGQLQANRDKLAQQGNLLLTDEYFKSDAEKGIENRHSPEVWET